MADLIFTLRHRRHVLRWKAVMWLAERLPLELRQAVLTDAAVRATHPTVIGRHIYAGPDGLDYKRLWQAMEFELKRRG